MFPKNKVRNQKALMKMVNILGVNPSGWVCHDSSACIVVNGKLIAAAEEERFIARE